MNDWIDIKDKMPEKDGRYLAIEKHYSQWIGISSMRNGKFDMEVTHWQQLPEPPRKRKNKS